MLTKDWSERTRALAVTFLRRAMAAANIDHSHLNDADLSAAVDKASNPGVRVVDEESAKEWVQYCNEYDYSLAQATRAEEMRRAGQTSIDRTCATQITRSIRLGSSKWGKEQGLGDTGSRL